MEHMKGIGLKFNFRGSGGNLELSGGSFEGCIRVFDQDKVVVVVVVVVVVAGRAVYPQKLRGLPS